MALSLIHSSDTDPIVSFSALSYPNDVQIASSSSNIFFNPTFSLKDLTKIRQEVDVDSLFSAWGETEKKFRAWASNNSSPVKSPAKLSPQKLYKFPFALSPPPGFEKIQPVYSFSDVSTESEVSPSISKRRMCSVALNNVKLKPVPKQGLAKREKRGTFEEEFIKENRVLGEIKFYQLKKRFGFICLESDGSDLFLCEDDLVLSGVNIKKFKEAVFKKVQIKLSLMLKNYWENGVQKRKAVDIRLITDIN